MSKLIIKNARIIDANKDINADILIKDGVIAKIAQNINEDCKVIDINQNVIMPSFIDVHTHLRDPGLTHKEDLESGQSAALKGGYTVLCPMANTKPVCDNEETIKYVIDKSEELNLCDIHQVSAITKKLEGKEITDIYNMRKYTNLFSDDGFTIFDEDIMKQILKLSKELDFKVLTHCQPEFEIVKRDLEILKNIGGNLHICHISLKETLNEIKKYKDDGYRFTCEVAPHHLYGHSIDYKVNPSFSTKDDVEYLIQGIKDGYIDMIATDHAPHTSEDKNNGAPGISNIEVAFGMVYKVFEQNDISLKKLSEMMSLKPAKLIGLNQGLIEEGLRADLVIIDVNKTEKIEVENFLSKGRNNPFDKCEIKGQILKTIRAGKIMYDSEVI